MDAQEVQPIPALDWPLPPPQWLNRRERWVVRPALALLLHGVTGKKPRWRWWLERHLWRFAGRNIPF